MKKLLTIQREEVSQSSSFFKWLSGSLVMSFILLSNSSLWAQTFTSINAPGTLVSCTTRDTVSVTVLNNTGAPVTNLRLVPTMGGFRYVSTVANANVTVLNASATAPIIQINSLAAGASQNVRFFIEAGCSANTSSIPIQLQTSGGTLITSQNTPIMTVYQPTLGMTGVSNTSISPSNETSAGLLSNLINGQTLVKGFRVTSNNSSAPLDEVRVYVLNTYKYWQSIGVSKGTTTLLGTGDTIMYTFGPSDFMTMGDGDGLFETTDGPFNFTDTMRMIGCNSDVTTNTSLKYFAAWGCFAPPVFCDKSSDVDAYANAVAANDNIIIDANPLNHPVPTMCSTGPNDTTAKMSFRIRNSNNEAGVAGSGTIYDLIIRLGKGDYPFNNDTLIGNQHIKILAAKVNGQFVPYSRTPSFGVRIQNLTAAQYTGGGLKDIDGDGFLDDLQKDSSVIVELFCNFRPGTATILGADNLQGGSNRASYPVTKSDSVSFGYSSESVGSNTNMLIAATQWKCNIVYRTPCKDKSITKSSYYLYTYWNSMPATSNLNPDFYNNQQNVYNITVREEYNYLNAYPRINNGSQYADSMISEFKVILPPGINLDSFSGKYGSSYNRTRVFQSEVDGPGDYDTATVRYARRMGGGGGAQDLQVYLKLDCSQLTNQCPGQDSVKWYSWQHIYPTSGATSPCHSTIVNWGYRPMRYHCNSYFKGLKMTSYDNKRITMGVRKGDTSINSQKINPNSAFANSDSIDRTTYLTYDTVIMRMKGVVTDTALAEPYLKVIIEKANYIQYGFRTDLNRSQVRIYDASTATYRSFKLGYFNIVNEPGGGNLVRTMYIPLKQYVDSMRAFDPTYLIGGNVGSSVYTQDSVLIDYYYHYSVIRPSDSLQNTNRDVEIFYTAEYRNDSLTGSRICDLFSEYNRLIELFNYGYQDNYNAVINGPCSSNGTVLFDFYFENRGQSGDYFRNEWHNNNYTQRIEYNYNPSFLSDPDSIYYSATIYQEFGDIISYRKLAPSKYTVSNGKVTIIIDSILGGRNQQHLGPLGVIFYAFQQPTCAAAGARQDLVGSIGYNTIDMFYNPYANSNLVINQKYSRGSTPRPLPIPSNSIVVSANPASVNMAQQDTLTWTINYRNNSANRFNHAWMDFRSPGLNVVKVEDITAGIQNKPIFTYFQGDVQQWAKLDTILAGATRTYKIYATISGCRNDSLNVTMGYNCKYYPVDPAQGYLPPYLYSCNSEQRTLILPVGIPPVQLQWAKITETPTSPINLCDTLTYTSRITNLNLSNLSQIKLNITLPTASNIQYLANSALLQWPEGGSYLSMGVTPTTSAGVMTFDLSSKFRGGVLPNSITPLDSNKALVRMRFITGCPFASGDQIPNFGITGKQPCGDVITGTGHTSQVLRINGLPVSPLTQLMGKVVSIDTLGVCGDTSTMRFRVFNTGGLPTNTRHSFTWEMPSDMNFVAGSAVISVPARLVSATPTNTVIGSKRVLKWSMSATAMNVNDSLTITFKSINTNTFLTCGNTNTAKLQTLESHTVGAACAPGGNCDVNFIIDTKEDTIRVEASRFALSNLIVSSVPNSPLGETVNYSLTITNNGEAYTGSYNLKFYGNTMTSDSVGIRTIAGGLAKGASTTITGTLNVPAGKACNLRIKLDSTGCFCSYPSISAPYNLTATLKDSTICSGVSLALGSGTITGYSYFWSDGATTSNNTKTFTNTDPNNNRIDTNRLVIDRLGCIYTDTTITTVKPIPSGLDITADNTCLLTNPITFTGSSTSSGVTYNWTFPGGGSSTTNPTDRTMLAGTQNVIINATKNGCSATYNENFVFYDLNISATPDNPTICFNTSTALRANSSNATNFQWYRVNRSTGARLATMGTAPTQSTGNLTDTTRYRVVVTNGTCTDSSDLTVNVISNVVVGRVDTTICPGQPVILSVPFTYNTANWTNLQSGATSTGLTWAVSPTVTTIFRVVAETVGPVCTATDSIYVTVRAVTLPVIAGVRTVCSGGSTTYTAAPTGTSPSWTASSGGITSGGVYTAPTVTSSTNVVITYSHTDVNGCVVMDTHTIVINPLPVLTITSSNASMCAGQTRTLTATPAGGTFSGTGVSAGVFTAPTTPNSYSITYTFTDGNGCVGTTSQSITVNPRVGVTAVTFSPTVVCVGSTTSASSSPSSGSWSVVSGPGTINAGTGLLSTTAASLITVRYTHPGISGSSCPDTIQGTITPVVRPTVAPSASPATICNGASTTIAANAASGTTPYTYAWNIGSGASHSQSPTSNTAYNVTVTDNNSCTATGTVNVTVTGSTPLAADAGSARSICTGASTNLGGSPTGTGGAGGYTYSWTSSPSGFTSTAANPSASPTATTTYTVTVTSSSCTVSSSVVVTVNPRPTVAPTASPSSICNGQSSTISAGAAGGTAPLSYTWNIGSGASHSQSPTATTAYNVTVTDANSCSASGTVTVNVTGSTPLAADAGSARAICNGASTTLGGAPTATGGAGGYTYSWSNSAGTTANPTVSPTATTTYTVTVTSSGCTVSSSAVVTVNPRPTVAPTATPSSICNGQSSTIAANGSGGTGTLTYTWSPFGTGASHSQSPSTTTSYNVTVSDANGCTASGSVTLNVIGISPLSANAGTSRTICSGVSTNLGGAPTATGGSGGYTYSWTSSPAGFTSAAANPTASPTATTTYTVTVTSSTCTATNTVVVTVNPSPSVAPSASLTTICNGQSTTISANATGGTPTLTYAWNNGSGASHTASPTSNTTYIVTVTDANGCTVSGSVSVTVTGSTPLAADAGSARAICNGASTNLGGSPTGTGGAGGYTYSWASNPAGFSSTTANPTASPTATTTYTVTVTSSGCTATSSVVVTVNPRPSVNVTAAPAALCNGQSTTISSGATGGTGTLAHTWSAGSGASFTATPSSTTSYSVTVTDANGCTASGSVTVVVTGTSPLVAVAGSARAICNGSSTTLGGSPTGSGGAGGHTYLWSGGLGTGANPVASPSSTTLYRVTVTSSGCTAVDSVLVTVNPRPNVAPSAGLTTLCYGASTTVSANASGGTGTITYNWSPSGSGSSFTATPSATTIYNVTATDANGCTASGNVSVNVTGSSPLTVNAGTNRTICNGSSTSLGATPTGNGGNTSGSYTYSWSSNPAGFTSTAANPTVSPTATTTYTVTVTNTGCIATSSVVVSVNPRPAAVPSASVNPVCSGSNTTITANQSGGTSPYTYQWNTSQTSASFVASPTTTVAVTNAYTVTVTDVNGCSISATINVNVTPLPVMTPIANQSVCIPASGGTVALSAAAMTVGQTGAWSTITSPSGAVSFTAGTSANTNVSTLSPINTYTFRWTLTETGCSNWTNTNVTVNESPVIEAGMPDTICRDASKTLSASLTSVSPATINWKVNTLTATPFAFSASTTVSPMVTTKYIFTAAITPCIVSDTVQIAVIQAPNLNDDVAVCLAATEDNAAAYHIASTIGTNDILTGVLKGGVTYKVVSSKNSTAMVSNDSIKYTPNLNFNGRDTVMIEAYSNTCTLLRDTSMFCVDVAAVNDKPNLINDTVKAIGTNPKTFNPLSNDSDIETTLKGGNITITSGPNHGTLTGPAANGEMVYTGNNANLAILDTIIYRVCDSGIPMPAQCDEARIIVQLVPQINDTTTKTNPGTPVTIGTPVTTGPGVILTPSLSGPSKGSGTASVNPTTGVVTFTPNDTPFIGKDTIRKVLCFTYPDGSTACDTSFIYISNPNVNNQEIGSTPMNTPVTYPALKPYKFEGGVATTTSSPSLSINSTTGVVTFAPKPGFVGIDTSKITRCDSKGNCVTDVYITVVTPNLKDTTVRVPQGLPVTLKMPITRYPGQSITSTVLNPVDNGTATISPDGSVTYKSNPNFTGKDTLLRRICVYDSSNMQTFCDTIMEIFDVFPHATNPDIAVGNMNETINGNVATNDIVLPGTTYGTPVASSSNPSSTLPTMNPNGTYTFNASVPGVYVFTVPVCPVGYTTGCPTETLTITVVDPSRKDNKPIVNADRAITKPSTPVKVDVLANDATGNIGIPLNRSSLAIATAPKNGTVAVNADGTITYTPNAGFLGRDTFYYTICDQATPPNCGTGMAVVNVTNEDLADVRDDVAKGNGVLTGNVLSNDKFPAGSVPSVKPVDTLLAGKGRLVIDANGNYTWTPVDGFNGSIQVPVTVCDGKTPQTCYTSTLHIVSTISADVVIPNYFSPNGDGINDVWSLDDLLDRYPNARAMIYNRWGNVVWRSTGPYGRSTSGKNVWYGQLEGAQDLVPDGVYYYLIEIEDEFKTTKTGFIEIMRQ